MRVFLVVPALANFEGEIVWDTSRPNGQPRRRIDVSRAERLFGFRAMTTLPAGLTNDRLVPRSGDRERA